LWTSLRKKGKITKKLATEAIELVFSAIGESLVNGEEISVPGFGKFSIAIRKARTGLNPQTKKKINIPKKKLLSLAPQRASKNR
jgi:DNA-binding protein HU-beta